jgi:hypothetical protein
MSTTGGKQFIACNHLRSYDYFTESITTTCPFIAYHCADYASFQVNSLPEHLNTYNGKTLPEHLS